MTSSARESLITTRMLPYVQERLENKRIDTIAELSRPPPQRNNNIRSSPPRKNRNANVKYVQERLANNRGNGPDQRNLN